MRLLRALEQRQAHPVLLPARPPLLPPRSSHPARGAPCWGAPWPGCGVWVLVGAVETSSRWFSRGCCHLFVSGGAQRSRGCCGSACGLQGMGQRGMHGSSFPCLCSCYPCPFGAQGCGSTGIAPLSASRHQPEACTGERTPGPRNPDQVHAGAQGWQRQILPCAHVLQQPPDPRVLRYRGGNPRVVALPHPALGGTGEPFPSRTPMQILPGPTWKTRAQGSGS